MTVRRKITTNDIITSVLHACVRAFEFAFSLYFAVFGSGALSILFYFLVSFILSNTRRRGGASSFPDADIGLDWILTHV
jgi:hypothetical protein